MNKINILFFLILFSLSGFAQVVEEKLAMSEGSENAFVINVPSGDKSLVEKTWKDYMKKYGKTKKDKKTGEWITEAASIRSVSSKHFVLKMKMTPGDESTKISTWLKLEGEYVTAENNVSAAKGSRHFLENFAYEVERNVVRNEIKEQEKTLKGMNKSMSKLVKDNEKFHDDIEKAEKKIEESKLKIEENILSQNNAKVEIENQEKLIESIKEKLKSIGKD